MSTNSQLTEIRAQILRQHVEIRARLRGIERLAQACHDADARRHLLVSLGHFASVFEEHLCFEERELAPLIRGVDAWGAERAAAIDGEHLEQRRRITTAVAFAEDGDVRRHELEGEVHWLAETLLADMAEEEATLLALEEIEAFATPQQTG